MSLRLILQNKYSPNCACTLTFSFTNEKNHLQRDSIAFTCINFPRHNIGPHDTCVLAGMSGSLWTRYVLIQIVYKSTMFLLVQCFVRLCSEIVRFTVQILRSIIGVCSLEEYRNKGEKWRNVFAWGEFFLSLSRLSWSADNDAEWIDECLIPSYWHYSEINFPKCENTSNCASATPNA